MPRRGFPVGSCWTRKRGPPIQSAHADALSLGPAREVGEAQADWRTDTDAFAAQYRDHYARIYSVALRMVGSPAHAEDIAQESFVRAWRARGRFTPDARFSTWVARIATNACLDYLKSGRRRFETASDAPPVVPVAPEAPGRIRAMEAALAVNAALATLPVKYRLPVVLRDLEDLSYAEIAEVMGLRITTLKMRVLRGREKLARALEATGEWP